MAITDPSCPYTSWAPSTRDWCEQQLCSVIREPANTWSNLAFVFVGIWILYHCRERKFGHLRLMGFFAILLGLMSGFYHATSSFFGEVLDYSSMFFISTFFICVNLARLRDWTYAKLKVAAFLVCVPSIALLVQFKFIGAVLFGLQFFIAQGVEFIIWRRKLSSASYRMVFIGHACFAVAYLIWNLDIHKIVCSPNTHWISGHAVWHVINAFALYFYYHFYRQFTLDEPSGKKV
jgi:hypothetical protein